MKALLDTHVFLWWITDSSQLSPPARKIISNNRNQLFLSAASGWEMAIKVGLGKLSLPKNLETFLLKQLRVNAVEVLPIQMSHALRVYRLPPYHQDPFDRILIAQSQLENLPIVTGDPQIANYSVKVMW